jgi:SRSO17 transposase
MEAAMAGPDAVVVQTRAAEAEIEAVAARLRPRFRRRAAHHHAAAYLRGLRGEVERKNGWQLAEHGGYRQPRTIQRVLDRSVWEADAVRDDLLACVTTALGDPAGVLVVDETGFLKKGAKSCGVARQYSGTAGRIENCQIGVFLGYASPRGRAGLDRALYLPKAWAEDAERRVETHVPEAVEFRTKPQLALEMIERALDAEVPARWVVADEVYGSDGKLRRALEARDQAYVLAVKSNEKPTTWLPYAPPGQVAGSAVAAALEPEAWQRRSCGAGAQGERIYDWACIPLRPALREGWVHALLVRRHPTEPDELAYYLGYAPAALPLAEIVRAAGSRWPIEDVFKLAKGQAGLDQYEVRSWTGWHRHTTLALLALAILAVATAEKGENRPTLGSCRSASRRCAAS